MEIREVKAKFIQELLQLGKRDLIYRTGLDSNVRRTSGAVWPRSREGVSG